jgi:AcrR family transcriptional regulator
VASVVVTDPGDGAAERPSSTPWAGDRPQPEAARRRLVAAAAACIARDGLTATTVASVAAEAGVSRPTVYRYFDDREDVVRAALGEAADNLRAVLDARTAGLAPADLVVEAVVLVVTELPTDPVLSAIWRSAALDGSVVGTFTGPGGIAFARGALHRAVSGAGWSDAEADEAAETVLRTILSLLVSPAPARTPDALRGYLQRRLLPSLGLAPPHSSTDPGAAP